jgi:carbonic anhydrase/acetyltransferase-like protein (isoleucine patch superfamily)
LNKLTIYKIKRKLFPYLLKSNDIINYLRNNGIQIGKGTIFYDPGKSIIDTTRPCLLSIGEYCKITSGVTILTHDYSRSVLRRVYGDIIGEASQTVIGNNVFIGINAIILMGTRIGNNVIVGAGAVVSGKIPDNVVIAGNPAKVVRTLEEHYRIRKEKYIEEAKWYACHFYKIHNRVPTIKEMDPFYPLFLKRDIKEIERNNLTIKLGGDNYDEVIEHFLKSEPIYNGYNEFLADCGLLAKE